MDDSPSLTSAKLEKAVRDAWTAAIGQDEFKLDQTLEQTGADSLRIMRFVLHLETSLSRRIPYDHLSATMTARSLISLLASSSERRPEPEAAVFFLAGVGGDESMLAGLRSKLHGFNFKLIDPPDLGHPQSLLRDMEAVAILVADDIEAHQPVGPIMVMGYSFGGIVAFETVRTLFARGRDISLLCLLDSMPVPSGWQRMAKVMRHPLRLPRKLRERFPRLPEHASKSIRQRIIDTACRLGAYGIAHRVGRGAHGRTAADVWFAERMLLCGLRVEAARRWRPSALDSSIPTLLVVSADGVDWGTPKFWRKALPRMTVVPVACSHNDLDSVATATLIDDAIASKLCVGRATIQNHFDY